MAMPLHVRDCLCLHARRGSRRITQFYDTMMRDSGLRVTQFLLLEAVGQMQPVAHQPLAEMLGMERTTLTRNLAVMERDGLATVSKGTSDRRENQIKLTRKGRAALDKAMPFWQRAQIAATEYLNGSGPTSRGGFAAATRESLDRLAALGQSRERTT